MSSADEEERRDEDKHRQAQEVARLLGEMPKLPDGHAQHGRDDHEREDEQHAGLEAVLLEEPRVEAVTLTRHRAVRPARDDAPQQERQEDVGDEEQREEGRVPEHPRQHPERVVLAPPRPAQLLLEELPDLERRIRVDEARVLVDGAVARLEREVRERAVVGHLEEDAEEPLRHEVVHDLHEDRAPEGDRATRQAADLPEHALRGHRVERTEFSSQSAQRVIQLRVGSRMRWRVVTPPTVGSAKGFTSSASVPSVQIDEHGDLARRELGADLDGVPLASDRRVHPAHERGELLADERERAIGGDVDDDDDLVGTLDHHTPEDVTEELHRLSSTTGTTTLVVPANRPVNGR